MENIDHKYTREITCPYCGEEFSDSWEFPEEGEETCYNCNNDFEYYRDIEVTYCTITKEEQI